MRSAGQMPGEEPEAPRMAVGKAVILIGAAVLLGFAILNSGTSGPTRPTDDTTDVGDEPTETTLGEDVVATPTTPPPRPPGEVKVLVANATRTSGAAGRINERLRLGGYMTLKPTDAPKEDASVIAFSTGYEGDARVMAEVLGLPETAVQPLPAPPPVSDLQGAHILVLVGPELANPPASTTTAPGAPAASSSTTRATTTTTR